MGCFGSMEPTKEVASNKNTTSNTSSNTAANMNSTTGPAEWIQNAGQDNFNLARQILDQGFQPYGGSRVAPLSRNEQTASDLVYGRAGSGNPWEGAAADAFKGYGAAPGYNYNFSGVMDPNGPLGSVQSYMNPYLDAVLAPALRQIGTSGQQQRLGINANATQAGAYGDARHGVVESEQRKNQMQQETDTVGKAWSDAFGQALGQRQQDLSRNFSTQQAQAGVDKDTLERMRTSGIDLTNLDKYGVSRDLGLAGALGQTGAVERGVGQQKADADFQEFMRQNGFNQEQVAFLTQVLKGTPTATTTTGSNTGTGTGATTGTTTGTETTSQPNNSGWQALGTAASLAAQLFL